MKICDTQYVRTNQSKEEFQALRELMTIKNIIVHQADEGRSLVVQDHSQYFKVSLWLLSDSHTYKLLTGDPLPGYMKELKMLIEEAYRNEGINKKRKVYYYQKIVAHHTFITYQRYISQFIILQAGLQ